MLDVGVWDRQKPLTKTQLKNRQTLFEQYQKEYNENKDVNFFWLKLHPLILDAVKAAVIKINGSVGYIPNYQEKVDKADMLLVNRYIYKPTYNFGSLSTLAYFAALYSSRTKSIIEQDKEDSYERIIEETLLHDDHMQSIYYQDYDNDTYCIDELY